MASQPSTTCVVCDKSASNKCGRCKTSIYCGKQCQASDWEEHKSACKDVLIGKTLERAASILHQAFLNFRENTWDTPVAKIEVKADALVIYDGPQPTKPRYFVDFPHKLVKDTETKMAVLCALACNEPLAWMLNLLRELVKGLQVGIHEVEFGLRSIPRKTTAVHPNGYRQDNWPNYSHFLLRVISTKTKTQWAMDIGGGQYGIVTPLWPWEDYVSKFVETRFCMRVYPLGTNRAILQELGKISGNPSMTYGMIGDVAGAIDGATNTFEKTNLKLSALVQLSDDEFVSRKEVLLHSIDAAVHEYKEKHDGSITAKHRAAQIYERKNYGLSSQRNIEATKRLFGEHLMSEEHATGIREYTVDGVTHFLV